MLNKIIFITYHMMYIMDIQILYSILKQKYPDIVEIDLESKHYSDNNLYIGHFNTKCKAYPKYFIQVHGDSLHNYKFAKHNSKLVQKATYILDYSKYNILDIKRYENLHSKINYVPYGYHSLLESKNTKTNCVYDIYLFGDVTPRRKYIYKLLTSNEINIYYPNLTEKKYQTEEDINKNINKSILTLSILIREGCNDLHRLRYAICNKTLFLGEETLDLDFNNFMKKYDLLCNDKTLIDKVKNIISLFKLNRKKYDDLANNIYNDYKKNYKVENFINYKKIDEIINSI